MTEAAFDIRDATWADVPDLLRMIRALAEFEKLTHLCIAEEADLTSALFGPQPAAEALIAHRGAAAAGFALFYHTFSTFLGRRSLWLEDLFVQLEFRRQGCAKQLLKSLASRAVERGCGRFEWTVLDWNDDAVDFYRMLGATVLPDWRIVRLVGAPLRTLAGHGTHGPRNA